MLIYHCEAWISLQSKLLARRVTSCLTKFATLQSYPPVPHSSSDRFWLFLEDLGVRELAMTHVDERRLFSRWLGWLHRWTCGADCGGLPDRSPAAYLQHLRSAGQRITENVGQPWVDED